MKRHVVWSDTARDDYFAILRYIAQENPAAVGRVADRIEATAAALSNFATGRAGRVAGTYEKVMPGFPYIIAYEILSRPKGGETVAILHVIHGARDWPPEEWPS